MKYVDIMEATNKGEVQKIGSFELHGTEVVFFGDEKLKLYMSLGLYNRFEDKGDKIVKPEDGLLFLQNLCLNIWGSRLWATEVKEK